MKKYIKTLILTLYISASGCLLYGWNNEHWLGNSERVITWNGVEPADYLRLGVLRDGVYRVSAADIATAFGISTNSALASLGSGDLSLTCGTNSVAWTTDDANLFFYGQETDQLYAPENVYFLRQAPGVKMLSQPAPPDSQSGTNTWFMQSGSHRSDFLDVTAYYDRRSSNASIIAEPVFGMSLGDSWCNRTSCEFAASLPGFTAAPATNINLKVYAISYGDYGAVSDTHLFEVSVQDVSCGTFSWDGEQKIVYECSAPLSLVTNSQVDIRITNLTVSEHILLLDVEVEYPCLYSVGTEPLICSGGDEENIAAYGSSSNSTVTAWDITDPLNPAEMDISAVAWSNSWNAVFGCGGVTNRYAVFEAGSCFNPSVTGFRDVNWNAAGSIPSLVIVTPPRRWVSGFEEALKPLVRLRQAQGLGVRVVDAEDIYNAFSYGLVTPLAFQRFTDAGVNSGSRKLRYLLFAGYASTDYKLEVFHPDTEFKNGKKGFPALFPLLQVAQYEPDFDSILLLPNDMMLGDADGNGVPDVAVGRFLATDASELSNMVFKTVAHDMKHSWKQAVVVSDWNGIYGQPTYYNFEAYCSDLATEYVNGGWSTTHYHCATETGFNLIWKNTYYETGVWYDLQQGRDFFYYLGHSSDTLMGHASSSGKYLLSNSRLSTADWSYAPFAMCMGCRMGRYTALDVVNLHTCLMETALKNPSSGFSCLISAAGYLTFGDAKEISDLISDEINLYGARRLGDAWTAAMDQMGAAGLADIKHIVLLGDPSMPLCKPRYPTLIKIK